MSKIRLGILTLGLIVAASSSAFAAEKDWGTLATPVCGGNTFSTCAAVHVNITDAGLVTMTVTNLSGTNGTYGGTVFTQVGMDMMPAGVAYSGKLISARDITGGGSVDKTKKWQIGTAGLSGDGIDGNIIGVDTEHGANGAIPAPHTFEFVFRVSGWSDDLDLDDAGFAIHGQSGPRDCSTKLVIGANGTSANTPDGSCGTSVTPEPVTILLLGTGLASMGGMGLLRRRKKNGDIENA